MVVVIVLRGLVEGPAVARDFAQSPLPDVLSVPPFFPLASVSFPAASISVG